MTGRDYLKAQADRIFKLKSASDLFPVAVLDIPPDGRADVTAVGPDAELWLALSLQQSDGLPPTYSCLPKP